jgi:hypothetical protein
LQRAAELPLVQVFDAADRQNTDREGGVVENVMDQLGRDGETVKGENLHIPQDIGAAEVREYATKWARVEAVVRQAG